MVYTDRVYKKATLTKIDSDHKITVGRDFSSEIGLKFLRQQMKKCKKVNNILDI